VAEELSPVRLQKKFFEGPPVEEEPVFLRLRARKKKIFDQGNRDTVPFK
jgi:hypothetical protein